MSKILPLGFLIGGVLCCGIATGGILQNEDFSSGLSEWNTQGAVFAGLDEVALTDENVNQSFLYQGVALNPGEYELTVNFRQLLSPEEPFGYARDTFFASVYLSATPEQFDPQSPGGFEAVIGLFNLDSGGAFDFSGEFLEDSVKAGYTIYKQSLSLTEPRTLFTVFELTNLNGINDNSLVLVDSVVIVIPEPVTALICGLVAMVFIQVRRKGRK